MNGEGRKAPLWPKGLTSAWGRSMLVTWMKEKIITHISIAVYFQNSVPVGKPANMFHTPSARTYAKQAFKTIPTNNFNINYRQYKRKNNQKLTHNNHPLAEHFTTPLTLRPISGVAPFLIYCARTREGWVLSSPFTPSEIHSRTQTTTQRHNSYTSRFCGF